MADQPEDRPRADQDVRDSESVTSAEMGKTESAAPAPTQPTQQFIQTLESAWQQFKPIARVQSLRLLRATIRVLEQIVSKLETGTEATETTPVTATQAAATTSLSEKLSALKSKAEPTLTKLQNGWAPILVKIRSRLPEAWHSRLSDRNLTAAIAGIALVLLWLVTSLFGSKPRPTAVATAPSVQRPTPAPQAPAPTPNPATPLPSPSLPPIAAAPTPAVTTLPSIEVPIPVTRRSPAAPTSPSGVTAPLPISTPRPVSSPPVVALPEQTLATTLQAQLAGITDRYTEDLILSVQPNLQASRLTVKMSSAWYDLNASRQDQLADELMHQLRELDFTKLEIVDSQNELVARSPVVGEEMVIFKRHKLAVG